MGNYIKTNIKSYIAESYRRFSDDAEFDNYNFNLGDCDIYAISLHRLYGYPLYAIRGRFLEPEWGGEREWDYEYCHVMAKLPNGNYLDSTGEQTEKEMLSLAAFSEDIKKVEIVEISEEEAINMFSCQDQEKDIEIVMNYLKNNYKYK
jgi:hypothetical protein